MTATDAPQSELLVVAEAIMRRVDDFKTVAVNGYSDPSLRDLLLSATREVLASVPERGGEGEVRAKALEEAAKVADTHAIEADGLVAKLVANGQRREDELPFRARSVASQCRAIAIAIRALSKAEGSASSNSGPSDG
jgi:hypothetical protein